MSPLQSSDGSHDAVLRDWLLVKPHKTHSRRDIDSSTHDSDTEVEDVTLRLETSPWMDVSSRMSPGMYQITMDCLQKALDSQPMKGDPTRHAAIESLMTMSRISGLLPKQLELQNVAVRKIIANNGYTKIFEGEYDARRVCVKAISITASGNDAEKSFQHEALLWRQLHHPRILPLFGIVKSPVHGFCLVSPWMNNGNVNSFLQAHLNFNRTKMLLEIIEGIEYLHTHSPPVVHGDIRGANILVRDDFTCCLADFSLATTIKNHVPADSRLNQKRRGWCSPEVWEHDYAPAPPSDIYSFGCTAIEVYSGTHPFPDNRRPKTKPQRPKKLDDPALWAIVDSCLAYEAERRPKATKLLSILTSFVSSSSHKHTDICPPNRRSKPENLCENTRRFWTYSGRSVPQNTPGTRSHYGNTLCSGPRPGSCSQPALSRMAFALTQPRLLPTVHHRSPRSLSWLVSLVVCALHWRRMSTKRRCGHQTTSSSSLSQPQKLTNRCKPKAHTSTSVLTLSTMSNKLEDEVWVAEPLDSASVDEFAVVSFDCSEQPGLYPDSQDTTNKDSMLLNGLWHTDFNQNDDMLDSSLAVSKEENYFDESLLSHHDIMHFKILEGPEQDVEDDLKLQLDWSPRSLDVQIGTENVSRDFGSSELMLEDIGESSRDGVGRRHSSHTPNKDIKSIASCKSERTMSTGTPKALSWSTLDASIIFPHEINRMVEDIIRQPHTTPWTDVETMNPRLHQTVMDALQAILDHTKAMENGFARAAAIKCLQAISRISGRLPSDMVPRNIELENKKVVARDGFSEISFGTYRSRQVCMKVLRFHVSDEESIKAKAFRQEALLWRQLDHPGVLPLLGIVDMTHSFCMVFPWMVNGNINTYLKANPRHDRLRMLQEIIGGINYLHTHDPPIVHANIRGANILVKNDLSCCLVDFGLTIFMEPRVPGSRFGQSTTHWMPPEVWRNSFGTCTPARDIYSFGCTVVEIYTGRPPFPDLKRDVDILYEVVQRKRQPPRPEELTDTEMWDIVRACLSYESEKRPTACKVHGMLKSLSPKHGRNK